jgi:hypothetical protein
MSFTSWLRTHHFMRSNRATRIVCAAAALAAITLTAPSASAAYITVYGGPTYTAGVAGYKGAGLIVVSDTPTAVGSANKYDASGVDMGIRAIRWNGPGTTVVELGHLGTNTSGFTESSIIAVNSAGTAVGRAAKYDSSGANQGTSAVRWQGTDTVATELGSLGTTINGVTSSRAVAINNAGAIVGIAQKYDGSGVWKGPRAVRWDDAGVVAIELGNLGTTPSGGIAQSFVRAINEPGTTVGAVDKYDSLGVNKGIRAVRWDASGTAATELGNLGTDASGATRSVAWAINDSGTAVGWAVRYTASGESTTFGRAVRWDASGTVATELGNLGTDGLGRTSSFANAINDAGAAVGYAYKYDSEGQELFESAVRWDVSGAATELGRLNITGYGATLPSQAQDINNSGSAVGWVVKYDDDSDTVLGTSAVYWGLDGLAVDLNTLIDPASGWTLNFAIDISDTGWVAGHGTFDPDGVGGQDAYDRAFLIQVPATAVPEPATVVHFGVGLVGLSVALRRRAGRNVARHLMRENRATRIVCAAAAAVAVITLTAPSASAAYINVYGGPTFTPGDGVQFAEVAGVNDAGAAVGNVTTEASALYYSFLVFRWDGSGAPAIELGQGGATDINEAGTAVGFVLKFEGTGNPYSTAVRWDASGAATELGNLGTNRGTTDYTSLAINEAGTAVGGADKYTPGGSYLGYHPVRWDASGTAATELDSTGPTSEGTAINNAGVVVGWATKIDSGMSLELSAIRWEASGTARTELDNLGTDASGFTAARANDINTAGTAVGWAVKYDNLGVSLGQRAVRWDASGTTATELGNLGTNPSGIANSTSLAINDAGTAIGQADKYDGSGESLGRRAVRWDATGTAAFELGNLGTNGGFTETDVFAINDAGIAVGHADDYDSSGANLGERAVYWGLDGLAVDLNTLIEPASGWTLNQAHAISNTGWIGGSGAFDPDGPGGQEEYARLFLIQIPAPNDLPGDYSGNGTVGPEDYDVWKSNFGSTTMRAADGNGDGRVNAADFTVWRNNLGAALPGVGSAGASPSRAAVPEPGAAVLFVLGMALIASGANPRLSRGLSNRTRPLCVD